MEQRKVKPFITFSFRTWIATNITEQEKVITQEAFMAKKIG